MEQAGFFQEFPAFPPTLLRGLGGHHGGAGDTSGGQPGREATAPRSPARPSRGERPSRSLGWCPSPKVSVIAGTHRAQGVWCAWPPWWLRGDMYWGHEGQGAGALGLEAPAPEPWFPLSRLRTALSGCDTSVSSCSRCWPGVHVEWVSGLRQPLPRASFITVETVFLGKLDHHLGQQCWPGPGVRVSVCRGEGWEDVTQQLVTVPSFLGPVPFITLHLWPCFLPQGFHWALDLTPT